MDNRTVDEEILDCLKKAPIFQELESGNIRRLAGVCSKKRIDKGYCVFLEGEPAGKLYVVLSGTVVEYVTGPNDLEMAVKERRQGDHFGEIGLLIDEPQFVTTIASEPTVLVVIPRNEFLSRVHTEDSISRHVMKSLAHRLLLCAKHSIAYAYLDASARLAYLVIDLEKDEGGTGHIAHSQEDLAQRCGLARQTVARILSEWREAGWVRTGRGKLEGINLKALRQILSMSRGGGSE
jgi:CRP/FNR family transcriptional regulator, cyclic AMP receptor protein